MQLDQNLTKNETETMLPHSNNSTQPGFSLIDLLVPNQFKIFVAC